MWDLYQSIPGFVLGFHGCDEKLGEQVLAGKQHLSPSNNEYDWLGAGIYFWESNPQRALDFAEEAAINPKLTKGLVKKPFVLGATIDLGICCNLFDSSALAELGESHEILELVGPAGGKMPVNKGPDLALRFLDRAVIELMHEIRSNRNLPAYDTVRAGFAEGGPLYPGGGFSKKSHIQIAVRNRDCIKGYFRPISKR